MAESVPIAPKKDPPLTSCPAGTDYYVDSSLRDEGGQQYSTFANFMSFAAALDPIFLLVHQYNEFALPDEGWNAQTSDDTEPANDGIGDGAVRAVRQLLQRYRTATAPQGAE